MSRRPSILTGGSPKKLREGLASALPNIVWRSINGICLYGRGEIDCAPRSCCGLREKTPLNFLQRVVEKLSNAVREGGPKSQKGLPDPPCLRMRLDTAEKNYRYFFLWGATAAGDFPR